MDRDNTSSPIPLASRREAEAFRRGKGHGPTLHRFRIEMSELGLATPWNREAARLFANNFLETGLVNAVSLKRVDVEEMFLVHLATLRNQHQKRLEGPEPTQERLDKQAADARVHRRRYVSTISIRLLGFLIRWLILQLWEHRVNATDVHPDLVRYKPLWKTIPYTAMSGDDLVPHRAEGCVRYAVTKLRWRSAAFEYWLRIHDWMWLSTRFHPDGRVKRGPLPRQRHHGSTRREEPHGAAIAGLPRNCYDADFLDGLDPGEREMLNIQPRS